MTTTIGSRCRRCGHHAELDANGLCVTCFDQAIDSASDPSKRAYRQANREKIAASKRAYYQANREKIAASQRAYRQAD